MTDISEIWKFDLRSGNSADPKKGACLLDAVSWFEYGVLGDHPECVCPVIAAFGRGVNDAMTHEGRQRLKVFIERLPGTVDKNAEIARAEYLAWQAIHVFVPIVLDFVKLPNEAKTLREFDGTLADAAAFASSIKRRAYSFVYCFDDTCACHVANAINFAALAACFSASKAAYAAARNAADALRYTIKAIRLTTVPTYVEDKIMETMDGVLRIGKQGTAWPIAVMNERARDFVLAAS